MTGEPAAKSAQLWWPTTRLLPFTPPSAAFKALRKRKPDVVVVKTAARDHDAVAFLECFKEHDIRVPIVVLVGAGASGDVAKVRRLGASAVLRWPTPRKRLSEVVAAPGKTAASGVAVPPALSATEVRSNLTQLRQRLNRDMKCFVGKKMVFIRPVANANGATANPRIALACPLRAKFGLVPHVFYEYIRDRCCDDSNSCPAVHIFRRRQP